MKSLMLGNFSKLSNKINKSNKKVKMQACKFVIVAKQLTLEIQKVEAMSQQLHLALKLLVICQSVAISTKNMIWMQNFFWLIWNFLRKILKNKLN